MLGFNWVDIIILILLGLAIFEGIRIGVLTQLFVIGGFLVGLFAGGWLIPYLLPLEDRTLRSLINANLVLVVAVYAAVKAFDLGQKFHWSLRPLRSNSRGKLRSIEAVFGSLPATAACLLLAWLLCGMIARLPFAGLSNSANDSLIVQKLTRLLPPVPAVLATFNREVDPNGQPYVFVQPKPQASFNYSAADVQTAATKAADSLVRITSFGCGSISDGSGFVAAPELVITNAHVIAGVKRPIIKHKNNSYEGVPIIFSPALDFAILRVPGLNGKPLTLAPQNISTDTSVAVLGYPGGNYLASPGLIRNNLNVFGRNIYDTGVVGRNVYEVQTNVGQGSSGGPVVLKDGRVAGVLFSKSTALPDYAYALASPNLIEILDKAETSYRRVSTGACLAD